MGKLSTRDGNALVAELNEHESGLRVNRKTQAIYGATELIQLSLRALDQLAGFEAKKPGRKLVIWISPGWPLLSGARQELSPKNQETYFNSIVSFSDRLRRARMTLYSIDPLGTKDAGKMRASYYEGYVKGVKNVDQVHIADLGLQVLAVQTGGRAVHADSDIAGEITNCIADADAFYVLSFDGLPGDGPNEYHSIEIKVDKPGLTARTRTGYYAQP